MKIEIELEEIESLRRQIETLTKAEKYLREENRKLDQDKLFTAAVELAQTMFNDYWNCICRELGFDAGLPGLNGNWPSADLVDWIRNANNQREKRLTVKISARVNQKFKEAFMDIGLDMTNIAANAKYKLGVRNKTP